MRLWYLECKLQNLIFSTLINIELEDGNYTYPGEHFVIYITVKSLCCIPETDITLYMSTTILKNEIYSYHTIQKSAPWYLLKGIEILCPHKNVHTDV